MLNSVLGKSGSGKTNYIQNLILQKLDKKEENILLVVPDQTLFDHERSLFNLVGEKINSKIKIMSFNTLYNFIFEKIIKEPLKVINNNERIILMNLAIDSVKENLNLYKNFSSKPEFINLLISTLTDFKKNNITIKSLFKTEQTLLDGSLKTKLKELIAIFTAYDNIIANTYLDPLDNLSRLDKVLSESQIFNGYTIIFDDFFEFSPQELNIIENLLKQSHDFIISICTDNENFSNGSDLFSISNKTALSVLDIAKKNNIKIKKNILLSNTSHFKSIDLIDLESNIFRFNNYKVNNIPENIFISNHENIYQEADFISKTIKKLVFEKNYNYNDFYIINCDQEKSNDILSNSLNKYEIPHFYNSKNSYKSPLIDFVLSIFDIVTTDFSLNSIFKYLKTGLTKFRTDEISSLEIYTTTQNLSASDFKKEFVLNSTKSFQNVNDIDLEKLNILRKNIIDPLLNFSNKIKNSTTKSITKATYLLFEQLDVSSNFKKLIDEFFKCGQTDFANYLVNSWDFLMDTFDQLSAISLDTFISCKKYKDLLTLLLSSVENFKSIKKLDEICIGSVNELKSEKPKVVFICACTDKNFPNYSKSSSVSGLFTNEEIEKINTFILNPIKTFEDFILQERFLSYKALTLASEQLYISWATAQPMGEHNLPSEIIETICSVFPNIKISDNDSYTACDEIFSKEQAFSLYAKHVADNSLFSQTLKHFLSLKENYIKKVNKLEEISLNKPINFQNKKTVQSFLGTHLKLSATQIEKYYMCPFQFFCKHSLNIKPIKPIIFDSLEYGKLIHFILEKTLSLYTSQQILSFSNSELENKIEKILEIYINQNPTINQNKSAQTNYLFSNIIKNSPHLIFHIARELFQSEFVATDFEVSIAEKGKIKPLILSLSDNLIVEIVGKVDRIDIMKKGIKNYIRVIDYKTGTKEFYFFDVFYGLNIQMLLYLLTILKDATTKNLELIPAGTLYMPARIPTISADKNASDTKIKLQKSKKLKMNGLILNSPEVIYGMEKEAKGEFIPVVMNDGSPKKTDSLVSSFEMETLLNYIKTLTAFMAMNLKNGNIAPLPVKGEYDACTFCDYSSVCNFLEQNPSRKITKIPKNLIFDEILKEMEKMNSCLSANGHKINYPQ